MGPYDHWSSIRRVSVLGAGTMGSGIAAHLANIGFEVTLFDLTAESAAAAFERTKAAKPPHFFLPETANHIRLAGIDQDLGLLTEADWVCEAIIEKMDAKRALFEQIEPILRPDAAISTNTSGLEISLLAEGRSESFQRRFLGTHFFNPPRYLKLLELIPTDQTAPEAIKSMVSFLEDKAARRVVVAKDTPGFIANRFGMWSMFLAVHVAEKLDLTIEQADVITGPFLGRPRSGSFRLNDLVGLDIMQDIASNLQHRCPNDPYQPTLNTPASIAALLERGWLGDKTGQGFYRREGKELVAYDFHTQAYRERREASFPSLETLGKLPLAERLRQGLEQSDEVGEYLRHYLPPLLKYADYLKEEISHSPLDFDRVMMWGFGWEMGPFAMIDAIGPEKLGLSEPFYKAGQMRRWSGGYEPIPDEPQYRTLKEYPILDSKNTLNMRDLGEGVTALCLTTKMGTINPELLREMNAFLDGFSGPLVLASEARHFSLGFDLNFFLTQIENKDWDAIDAGLDLLQKTAVRLSTLPIVSAVHGYCLGAGLELAFQCPTVCALADSQIGFPESKVGLYPGGGGTAETALRARHHGVKGLIDLAKRLTMGDVSNSADQARMMGWLRPTDVTVYHPERLITEARALAKGVVADARVPWPILDGPVTGMIDQQLVALKAKEGLSDYDITVGDKIKQVISKPPSFEAALESERSHFIELCQKALTQARIKHMLETGKPLRN